MAKLLVAAGAAFAVMLELIEAMAIVLAVGISRRWRDAVIGAVAAVVVCAAVAALAGPVLLEQVPEDALEVVIGALLLLFGLEWLRKATLRLAGRRARSSAQREHLETLEALETLPPPRPGRPDWPGARRGLQGRAAGGDGGHPGSSPRWRARRRPTPPS